jgi:predicted MarR family transcription regulator
MLGTPRSTVTLAARMLQKAGLIDYSRGHIQICNRKGLEESACECYRTIRNECDRLQIFS